MGLQRKIAVTADIDWSMFVARLAPLKPVVRMIDGLPAFPDEQPEPGWQEVRVTLPGGMVTLKKEPGYWLCTIWGDSDDELTRSWEACCNAIASA